MSTPRKMFAVLAVTDSMGASFKTALNSYKDFFKNKQGSFKGIRKTYTPADGTIDDPGKRGYNKVVTTVDEKLQYLKDTQSDYIDNLFALEATNAAGIGKAELIVDGTSFGVLSTLELLRLKSLLENGDFKMIYEELPVRSDAEQWLPALDDEYNGRKVYAKPMSSGESKSIVKKTIILADPNIANLKDQSSYKPVTGQVDEILTLGSYTVQEFSGEISHRERAEILLRRQKLLNATIEALKVANDIAVVESDMNASKLFGYLHTGSI